MNAEENRQKNVFQLIWGVVLILAGLGVFIKFHLVLPQIAANYQNFSPMSIRICFYLMGILLIGGGSKKIYKHFTTMAEKHPND
jgi:hypothetical protein